MSAFEQIKTENEKIASDVLQLAEAEDSRLSVITAIFIRLNNEMRLNNIQDIRKDISYSAKSYGLLPEKYVTSMDSIVRSYVQETNRFMKVYNDEFMNIQNILKNAEEKQKYYFFKVRETIVMKNICILAGKSENEYHELDVQIQKFRKKIGIYERIIVRCSKEFEYCQNKREQDFNELFEVKQEQALAIVQKQSLWQKIMKKIKNKVNGYENFSKAVLQKYARKLNRMKIETIKEYVNKTKHDIVNFSNEIEMMIKD